MDPLPEVITPNYDQPYTPSEQATLHNLKSEFKDNLTKSLETLQEKLRAAILDGFESKKNNSGSPARRATLSIEDAPAGPIAFKRTKATIDNLAREIDDIENLIYLIRNINIENADLYSNTVMSRSAELVRNVFGLNRYLEKWTLLQTGKELKPMEQEKEDSFDRLKEDLRANTNLDNYRLNGTHDMILNCVRSFHLGVAKNIENNTQPTEDKKAIEEKLIVENHAIVELKNELTEIDKLEGEEAIMEYLYKSKEKLREIVDSTEKLQEQVREQARAQLASAPIAPREESKEEEEDLESLVSPKFDEETANIIDKYTMKEGKLFKDFLNMFREQVKEQLLKLMALDRYLVQAAYIPFFFEEKFVSFRAAVKNDFAQENIPKMLEDFFIIADNEYWKVSASNKSESTDVHSAYFCYVAQNKYDFYLFRYTPSSATIQVYMTAPPMVSVLHKHLSKLNLKHFSKNNFQITYISYYDEELGVELRNFFLQNTQTVVAKYAKAEGVSNEMRYLVYATVFMLYNTVVKETTQGLTISAGNFVTFFNYIAEFQAVFLRGKEMKPDEFARFEFCYPFIDKRRPKPSSFLLFNKADSARGKGIDSIRRDLKDNYRPNLEVFDSEKGNKKTDYVAEIQGYLQRNTKKSHFVLDSPEYLRTHIAKIDKNTKDEIKVFSKFESQNLFEAYSTGTTQESSIENPLTGPSYLHFPFPGTEETANLLLISLNKINNSARVYLLDNSQSELHEEQNKNLQSFIEFLLKTFYMDQYAAKTCYIRCTGTEEIRLQYAYHYFPYTYLFDYKQEHTEKEKVELTQEVLVGSFEFLLNQNIPENTLDTIKACCLLYQEKISPKWRLVNYPIFWKHLEVASALEGLTNQMTQDKLDSAIMSFSFMGAMGLKAYYIHIQVKESTTEQQEGANPEQPAQPAKPAFMITLYSLSGNLDLEDREMMARIIYLCHTIGEKSIILNNSIYERNNILLYSQPYITMSALSYLVNSSNMTPKDAFKKLTRSLVAHYEVLDSLVEYLDRENSKENLSLISSIKNSGDWNLRRKTEGPISYSLFEDMGQEADFKKRIASEVPDILDKLEIEEISKTLVEKINTSDVCMDAFAFIVDDVLVNKVITNEDNLARDREACSNLLTWIKAKKKKYEEGKRVTYNRTNIFLVLPKGLCEGNGVCIVKYILEERRVVTYHLDLKLSSDEKTTADENIKEFISNINAAIDLWKQPEDIEFTTVKIALPDALEKTCKTQYILMTSFFIWVLNQNERDRNNRVRITLGVLNEFLCKYAEELFSAQVSESRVKKQYLPLSSAFIKKNPVIEKEPALVMYVSGNLTLDQAMAIKGFIGSFKAGYLKLEEVNHAFFNFGIALKDTVKHFLLHITRKSDRFVLDIFTNNVGDCDTALEIMVKNCCLEAVLKKGEVQAREKVFLHRISVPNKILTTYMEIAGMLIAYAVCNGVDNVNKYVGMIANSPVHFVNELRNFEEKCSKNGLLRHS